MEREEAKGGASGAHEEHTPGTEVPSLMPSNRLSTSDPSSSMMINPTSAAMAAAAASAGTRCKLDLCVLPAMPSRLPSSFTASHDW